MGGEIADEANNEPIERLLADPAFRALASSLWGATELRGAALLVGAGMSRNAVLPSPTSAKPPLWSDLLRAMREDLGTAEGEMPDALETAQIYEDTFGRGRLEGLVRRLIPDTSWKPGVLHDRLLRLPWTEVLSTNYDTLLERAADLLGDRVYEVTLTPADIARTRAPRIVKLHGTLPSHTPFVITEKDYRAYPDRCALFVNLARQVLLENDLCMLGFSGDDPNLREWSGWVRDAVAPYARTMFMVGVLDLTGDGRKYYLERGMTPIDLGPMVPATGDRDKRNALALELFFSALERACPTPVEFWPPRTPWPPSVEWVEDPSGGEPKYRGLHDPDFAAKYVERCAGRWRSERETYPGWIEPPPETREAVSMHVREHVVALRSGLKKAEVADRVQVLSDVLWRLDLVHGSLYDFDLCWLEPLLSGFDAACFKAEDRLLIGRLLARTHRERGDRQAFERWRAWLEADAENAGEAKAASAQEGALWARDRLDLERLSELVDQVRGDDPAWSLRRAALLTELGEEGRARADVLDAFRELKGRTIRDRNSIWIRSRMGWACLLGNVLVRFVRSGEQPPEFTSAGLDKEDWRQRFKKGGCDPWEVVEALDAAIDAAEKTRDDDRRPAEAHFDAGAVSSPGVVFRTTPVATVDRYAERLADRAGVPAKLAGMASVMATRLARAVNADAGLDPVGMGQSLVAVSRSAKPLLGNRFNRIAVARLDQGVAEDLASRIERAVDFALPRLRRLERRGKVFDGHWLDRLRVWTELLSRLVVRLPPLRARSAFERALTLAHHEHWIHPSLFEPLAHLIERSLESMPRVERQGAVLDLLLFPLPGEKDTTGPTSGWPNPLVHLDTSLLVHPADTRRWSDRVQELVRSIAMGNLADSLAAATRLEALARADALNEEERQSFGAAIWSRLRQSEDFPAAAEGALSVLVETPSPDPGTRMNALRSMLLERLPELSVVSAWLIDRVGVQDPSKMCGLVSTDELLRIFDALVAWRPPAREQGGGEASDDLAGPGERLAPHVVRALARSVLPALQPGLLCAVRLEALRALATEPPTAYHIALGPQAVRHHPPVLADVAAALQRALLSRDRRLAIWSLSAVRAWSKMNNAGDIAPPPDALVGEAVNLAALRTPWSMPDALTTAAQLVDDGLVGERDTVRLMFALGHLLAETDYASWSGADEDASTLGLVRAGAIALSRALTVRGHDGEPAKRWLSLAAEDPMPEVRHAAV